MFWGIVDDLLDKLRHILSGNVINEFVIFCNTTTLVSSEIRLKLKRIHRCNKRLYITLTKDLS